MNILCVCQDGNTRSVAFAYVLKHDHGQNAMSSGWHYNSPEPINMLSRWWAQRIVLVENWDPVFIPPEARHKIRVLDIGPDRWHECKNPELLSIVRPLLSAWADRGFA